MAVRSLMFVPAKEKTLAKVGQLGSDAYIIDLEDSIEENNKESALIQTIDVLRKKESNCLIYIRLNKQRYVYEATQLLQIPNIGFMLPKFEDPYEYQELSDNWNERPVIALVETPKGIVNVHKIAECSWINSIAFGAEDYTAAVNMDNSYEKLLFQKSMLITYAKAYGKAVYDTPSFQLNDETRLEEEIIDAMKLGFDGKLAIHPKQIDVINRLFSFSDIKYIKEIVRAYEQQDKAVLVYDGKPYEKMHIARFKRIIKENGGC